jgi:hypothetical protein
LFPQPDRTSHIQFSEAYSQRISFLKQNIKTFVLFYGTLQHFLFFVLRFGFFFFRFQQHSIERAMDLTDSFTWEDLPKREAKTGQLTAAGWISLTMKYSVRATIAFLCFHTVQSTIRMVKNHETMVVAWYPFDWTVSPFYELVNISQVSISGNKVHKNLIRTLLNYS